MADFASFKSSFKGDVVTPSDPDYAKAISRWAVNSQKPAKVVAFVKDAEDVSLAIKYASGAKLPIAIKGGGHSSAGASSSENGLVIDLSKYLNGVEVDPAKKIAKIGGGAVWETVDKAAIEHGLASVGGTVNHTGVGGLILGGGYGWLTAEHGLVIDNLVQTTMVVGDGRILVANETTNSDLFWAVRGGGSNFGVCTEFVVKLHDQRRTIFSGMLIFPPPALESVVKAIDTWWKNGPSPKESLLVILTRGPDGNPCVAMIPFFNGSEEDGRKAFKFLYDLNPVADMCKEMPYEMINSLQNPVAAPGKNYYIRGVSQLQPRADISQTIFDGMVKHSSDGEFHVNMLFEYLPLGKVNSVAHDATAFRSRGPQNNVVSLIIWGNNTPENTAKGRAIAHELTSVIVESERPPSESDNSGYGNYEGEEKVSVDRTRLLFGDNYPKLQQIKKKYDPELLFSKWFPIQPA
ncbi:FAD-binding domain-containing protein [Rickenella mellea]|uniref:FAD-binding domain-containing protein n=1 Tax=Rickenella mellea TaxID=50990 RepID=A0A4R5XHM1_9AGAM|nr:FAD-binding domain-containing protein [Rickenella mellea]